MELNTKELADFEFNGSQYLYNLDPATGNLFFLDSISISKTSSDNELFHWNILDIAFLDKFTKKQGMSIIKYRKVHEKAAFPYFKDFFKELTFTVFYLRLQDNKNVLKVELPYKASKEEVFRIIKIINTLSVQGYPYLLNKAHNDVVITDKNIKELLK